MFPFVDFNTSWNISGYTLNTGNDGLEPFYSIIQSLAPGIGREMKVHKTFPRCPRRFLNVLYKFNLRPVFRAYSQLILIKQSFVSETYSEPSHLSTMELFAKMSNDSMPLTTFTDSSILDV